jgi:hypothetical protein
MKPSLVLAYFFKSAKIIALFAIIFGGAKKSNAPPKIR